MRRMLTLATFLALTAPACENGDAEASPAPSGDLGRTAITVDGEGYHPATVEATRGQPITLVFTRTTDQSCGEVVVFPDLGIQRDLPLNRPVEVTITPEADEVRFTCGMGMYRGTIVAHAEPGH